MIIIIESFLRNSNCVRNIIILNILVIKYFIKLHLIHNSDLYCLLISY